MAGKPASIPSRSDAIISHDSQWRKSKNSDLGHFPRPIRKEQWCLTPIPDTRTPQLETLSPLVITVFGLHLCSLHLVLTSNTIAPPQDHFTDMALREYTYCGT